MLASGGSGGGGRHYVGLHGASARALAATMAVRGSEIGCTAGRLAGLLADAGADAAGVATPAVLHRLTGFLDRHADDLRWRVAVIAGDHRGAAVGFVDFASATAARAAGERYARRLEAAMDRYWDAFDTADEHDAAAAYFRLLDGVTAFTHDPAWAAGLVNRLGTDHLFNALWIAKGDAPGDGLEVARRRRDTIGPLFAALATAMEHRLADPSIRTTLLSWDHWDLAAVLALAPAETGFLTTAARRMLVDAVTDDVMNNEPRGDEYALIFAALAENPAAAFTILTGHTRHGIPNTAYLVLPWDALHSPEAQQAFGAALEAGLVAHPAANGRAEWALATAATQRVIAEVAPLVNLLDDVHPDLNVALAGLLRPHLDAIAVAAAHATGSTAPDDLAGALPRSRPALDVDLDTLHRYLGAVMQQDEGVAAVQLLLATYSQQPQVQANRLPLLSQELGSIHALDAFATDSVRIAALAGAFGAGMDVAGKDEEARTRLLVGALSFVSGKTTGLIPAGRHPAAWLAQKGARYLAGEAIDEFERWLASREPMEGEIAVGAFLESYADTTMASLREHLAGDPQLSQLSPYAQAQLLDSARHWVRQAVRGPLLEPYAELVGETATE